MMASTTSLLWLITGCSSGFGFQLFLVALKAGHKVIATSRNPSKDLDLVQQIEKLGGIWLALDVNSGEAEIDQLVEMSCEIYGKIDILVNNAGVRILGAMEDMSYEETRDIMETNFFGPFKIIKSILPYMRSQKSGTIVNISSAAGLQPRPSMSIYGASKWALEGMSEGLAKEVAPFEIRVLIVQPGAFTTNMMDAVHMTEKPLSDVYKNTQVGEFVGAFGENATFAAPNDVEKGCQAIFKVITSTGRGANKVNYIRMPLSKGCAQRTREHIKVLQEGHDVFRDIWESTEHDGGVLKAFQG
ncbi:838776e8-a29c-4e5a-bd07-7419bc6bf1dd-CDS [Sclerotinia trifoliorum]|uniref:838776e8-a29c-4e5a-bd07-7419bc6bf1dd-CDS n=1 Tax=Sclerotinia trifoliorum TaxID=28548 RepID=A0A8H2W216_9HELO|nr:838776e8-a29c-4e5a-bd07-7419bc6bf1dd-CDS [Sclerotinia trifoliorum]